MTIKPDKPEELASMGESYLEEAILLVLLEAKHKNRCLGAAEISRQAGIFREGGGGRGKSRDAPKSMNDAIATGLLIKLLMAGKVERCPMGRHKGWQLTDSELARRRDDVST